MRKGYISRGGFALPTVLIASVVMLTIMTVSVSSVATIRNSLKVQYYEQIAKIAGEAGVAYAKACLAKNGNVPLWTDEKPLTPATDCAGNSMLTPAVQALVVAGGGGGGAGLGGGGGGGGVQQSDAIPVSAGTYPVVVGSGGAGGVSQSSGLNGGNSSFASVSATGGGGGGARVASGATYTPAGDGGSGGGGNGTRDAGTGSGAPGGSGIPGEGNDGGMGSASTTVNPYAGNGGGGGGAGGPGGAASGVAINTGVSGAGGNGLLSDISGQQIYYGAGGSGGRWESGPVGAAGLTGGGTGASGNANTGGAGQANTGAGGGGGSSGDGSGGAGGSGVVVIRYGYSPTNQPITATGGTVYQSGPYRVHRFTSNANFTVTGTGTASCPTDPRCSVTVNENLRSSFSVTRPSVDEAGRAVSIPNSGYVELLRDSTGEVWRTYRQPATQVAVAPDLCSGAATSPLGWSNAVRASAQASLPGITTAQTITLADEPLNAGRMYYRKDFTVNQSDTYTVVAQTSNSADVVEIYVDGVLRTTAQNGVASSSISLSAGCHTVTAKLTNKTLLPRVSNFTAAIQREGSEPIVATDTTWRASAGSSVSFSHSDFYADPSIWTPVGDLYNAQSAVSNWGSKSSDDQAHLIVPPCNSSCPPSSSTYLRDSKDFIVTDNVEVLVSALCDDDCAIYVDGNLVIANSPWSNINQQTLTLTAGVHRIGARLYNSGAVTNPSKIAISVYDKTNGQVLTRTDTSWLTSSDIWISGTNAGNDPMSYEDSFRPSPNEIPEPVIYELLTAGGGGGGGGNCNTCGGAGGGGGGGVIFQKNVASVSTLTITIGGGGGAGAGGASRTNGGTGANTTVASTVASTLIANGGGGGGAQLGTAGLNGASGGGGSGGGSPAAGAGGSGIAGKGWAGGAGSSADAFNGGGGGGAGGTGMAGTTAVGGDGGPGFITYITGTRMVVGAGGGGGAYGTVAAGAGDNDSAGDGARANLNGGVGYSATANRGGGGGGANGSTTGASGGSGSAGITVIRFKKDSLTYTLGGSGTRSTTEVTIMGITYIVITFTGGTSTFTISSVNP